MTEFNSTPDMDSPKPPNDFEPTWNDDIIEAKMSLYNLYGNHVFECFEAFCDRMHDKYGSSWVTILERK